MLYQATLSDALRAIVKPDDIEMLKRVTADAVAQIVANPEIAQSLKNYTPGDFHPRRQIDIRAGNSSTIVLKLFVGWSHVYGCWHVLIEDGNDDQIEKQILPLGSN